MKQKFRPRVIGRKNAGISEVVGAMILLIVVVVAVGSFAYYLSATQQAAQSRQTYINSVKNEDLINQHIQLASHHISVRNSVVLCPFPTPASPSEPCPISGVNTGDDIVVGTIDSASTAVITNGVSDNGAPTPNMYTHIISSPSSSGDTEAWFAPVKSTSGSLTVTVNWATTPGANAIILYDVGGASPAIPTAGNFSSGSSSSSAPYSSVSPSYTPRANSLVIGILNSNCVPLACTVTAGAGDTLDNPTSGTVGTLEASSSHGFNTGVPETTPFGFSSNSQFSEVSLALILDVPSAAPTSSLTAPITDFSITVQNLNTAQSQVVAIQVDNTWLKNFYSSGFNYNTSIPLLLPPKSSVIVQILTNFSSTSIYRNQTMQIVLLSRAGNYFTTVYDPPTAIVSEQVTSEPLVVQTTTSIGTTTSTGVATTSTGYSTITNAVPTLNDFPVFSGLQSQAQNSTFISGYFWTVSYPAPDRTSFTYSSSPSLPYRASLVRSLISGPFPTNYQGPFTVTLMTEDANGFTWTSSVAFPPDPNISLLT